MSALLKILPVICIISCLLIQGILCEKVNGDDGAGKTLVIPDSLPVYSKPAAKGNVVKDLKKGEQVITDVELTGADGVAWCNVRRESDETIVGYVKCEGLKKTGPSRPERWQPLPTLVKPSRPIEQKPAEPMPPTPVSKAPEQATPPEPQAPQQPPVVEPSYPDTGRRMGY